MKVSRLQRSHQHAPVTTDRSIDRSCRRPHDVWRRRKELRQIVLECLDKIPEPYRLVVVLRDIEELDAGEAAEFLGISKNTLKVRLHRARQALKTVLEREVSSD